MNIADIINKVNSQVQKENNSSNDLRDWVRKEHAKIDDPKFKSYSWIAELINPN